MSNKGLTRINKYIDGFLSLIYPEFCQVCEREMNSQEKHICFACHSELHYTYFEKYKESHVAEKVFWGRLNIEHVFPLLYYEKGNSTQKILHRIKYQNGTELGEFMGKKIGEKLAETDWIKEIDAIVPIPIHSKKEFIRGYNQSLLIAKGLSDQLEIPIYDVLYRKTHDESQTRKSKEERYLNVKDKFAVKKDALLDVNHVLIVDDVLTTGSTLEFASLAVMDSSNSIKVSLATVAVAHG